MDRDLELRIKGHLYEIAAVNDEIIESRQGFVPAEEGYTKTLRSVASCSGAELVDQIAEHIKEQIRSEEARPSNQSVRRVARLQISEAGYIPDTYLNRA